VYVARDPHEKAMQRALIQYRDPKNYDLVTEALIKANRREGARNDACGGFERGRHAYRTHQNAGRARDKCADGHGGAGVRLPEAGREHHDGRAARGVDRSRCAYHSRRACLERCGTRHQS
ncbi:DUF3362 domain-containing protein, partial [Hominenteromicrobium sp.]|uniref:DUF3362 domain-containing protein n=1 Tax=Hominenteromicrobium sp. TaxID=3073581 RepID=UPI003AEF6EED